MQGRGNARSAVNEIRARYSNANAADTCSSEVQLDIRADGLQGADAFCKAALRPPLNSALGLMKRFVLVVAVSALCACNQYEFPNEVDFKAHVAKFGLVGTSLGKAQERLRKEGFECDAAIIDDGRETSVRLAQPPKGYQNCYLRIDHFLGAETRHVQIEYVPETGVVSATRATLMYTMS